MQYQAWAHNLAGLRIVILGGMLVPVHLGCMLVGKIVSRCRRALAFVTYCSSCTSAAIVASVRRGASPGGVLLVDVS